MKAGKQNQSANKPKNLVTTMEQAQLIFRKLFEGDTEETLTDGVVMWLENINDKSTYKLFLSLPELLEEHAAIDFLNADVVIPGTTANQCRTAGLAMFLVFLIGECWILFGEKLHQDPDAPWPKFTDKGSIKEVLGTIPLQDYEQELGASVMYIVGKPYFNLFLEKLKILDVSVSKEDINAFEKDVDLARYLPLMMWFGLMRFFLNAVYFYFGEDDSTPVYT